MMPNAIITNLQTEDRESVKSDDGAVGLISTVCETVDSCSTLPLSLEEDVHFQENTTQNDPLLDNGSILTKVQNIIPVRSIVSPRHNVDQMPPNINGNINQKHNEFVIKELGIKSTVFIGPACRPKKVLTKTEIQDKLNEFYKELEQIEPTDSLGDQPSTKSSKHESPNLMKEESRTNYTKGIRPHHSLHPHPYQQNKQCFSIRQRFPFPHGQNSEGFHQQPYQYRWQNPPPSRVFNCPPEPSYSKAPYCTLPLPGPFYPMNDWLPPEDRNPYHQQFFSQPRFFFDDCHEYGNHGFPLNRERYDHNGSNYNVGGWPQPYGQRYSDGDQNYIPEEKPYQDDLQQTPDSKYEYESSLVLILMRGVPGSGKTSLAQKLLSTGPNGLVLSTDDYFSHDEDYSYEPCLLQDAHQWNQNRAKKAMYERRSPVIIDNTNIQAWEMKPYVILAMENRYRVHFHEPDNSWKFDPLELERRNKHGVRREKIAQMLERFEVPISLDIVLNSKEPCHKRTGSVMAVRTEED